MIKRGLMVVSKDLYNGSCIDDALFGLRIKVFKVEYDAFYDVYSIHFVSPFCEEVTQGIATPKYAINVSTEGFSLVRVSS